MKKLLLFFIILAVVAAYPFLQQSEEKKDITGLPWQITKLDDGAIEVFGVQPGKSTLADSVAALGNDYELAIVVTTEQDSPRQASLEMYYGHYRAGLLSGKLVLLADVNQQDLIQWQANAAKSEYMSSGKAKKYYLVSSDVQPAISSTVRSLTFIPAVNLDEEIIVARFGLAGNKISKQGVTHFQYPELGLDIAMYNDAKEVLQYVHPEQFGLLGLTPGSAVHGSSASEAAVPGSTAPESTAEGE